MKKGFILAYFYKRFERNLCIRASISRCCISINVLMPELVSRHFQHLFEFSVEFCTVLDKFQIFIIKLQQF